MNSSNSLFQAAYQRHQAGDFAHAAQLYRQALQQEPANALAWSLLGAASAALGKLGEAAESFRQAIQAKPDYLEAYNNLGIVLTTQGRLDEAVATLEQALRQTPESAETHNHLGSARAAQGHVDQARASYEHALRLRPGYAEAHNNLGILLMNRGKLDEALASFENALRCQPALVEALVNRGTVQARRGNLEQAEKDLQRALAQRPNYAPAHLALGSTLGRLGKLEEAVLSYRQALRLQPGDAEARYNLGTALLLLGRFEEGWPEYDWRWQRPPLRKRSFAQPEWDGSPLEGRTILLWAEQGLGDTIQFVRYAPLVQARGGKVALECQPALAPLLTGCRGIDQLVPGRGALPAFDVQASLVNLPRILGTTLATIPAEPPYLFARADLVEHWRQELSGIAGIKIGIAWQGDPQHSEDRNRSIPLTYFSALADLPGVRLISLQKGPGVEQLTSEGERLRIIDLGDRLDETGPFLDTAAVMKNLDLVVTCDSVCAHLAGALGVPVWVGLAFAADWRWLLQRTDSPWYPSMRLFRQEPPGDWPAVFARMADTLRKQALPLRIEAEIGPGELVDKITILEIKRERLQDQAKLRNVALELEALNTARERAMESSGELTRLTADLKAVNEALWEIEDEIRVHESRQDFGSRFIELARAVYHSNDRRAALKRQINELAGSEIVEEKSYEKYA